MFDQFCHVCFENFLSDFSFFPTVLCGIFFLIPPEKLCLKIHLLKIYLQNSSKTWVETDPQLTECFKQTILIWVPCGFLAIFSILDFFSRSKSRYSDIPWSFLNVSKSLVLVSLICLTFIDLSMMLSVDEEIDIYNVQIVSVGVKAIAFVSKIFLLES